jgi:hypothetical protein
MKFDPIPEHAENIEAHVLCVVCDSQPRSDLRTAARATVYAICTKHALLEMRVCKHFFASV